MDAIFSIKPQYAASILSSIKKIELRKVAPKKHLQRIWIYETAPRMAITGWFEPGQIYPPMNYLQLYESFGLANCIGEYGWARDNDLQILRKVLGERLYRAIQILEVYRIEPIDPIGFLNGPHAWRAPQSWRYLEEWETDRLRRRA